MTYRTTIKKCPKHILEIRLEFNTDVREYFTCNFFINEVYEHHLMSMLPVAAILVFVEHLVVTRTSTYYAGSGSGHCKRQQGSHFIPTN